MLGAWAAADTSCVAFLQLLRVTGDSFSSSKWWDISDFRRVQYLVSGGYFPGQLKPCVSCAHFRPAQYCFWGGFIPGHWVAEISAFAGREYARIDSKGINFINQQNMFTTKYMIAVPTLGLNNLQAVNTSIADSVKCNLKNLLYTRSRD